MNSKLRQGTTASFTSAPSKSLYIPAAPARSTKNGNSVFQEEVTGEVGGSLFSHKGKKKSNLLPTHQFNKRQKHTGSLGRVDLSPLLYHILSTACGFIVHKTQ